MPKLFDKIAKGVSAVTPDVIEDRIPRGVKRTAKASLRVPWEGTKAILSVDHEIGLQLAQALLPKTNIGGFNIEGIGAEFLRPSNLIPVSKASALLKTRSFGPPLLRALAKEAGVAGVFSGLETARLGGSPEEVAKSTAAGATLGAITPIGLEGAGTAISRIRGIQRTAGIVDTPPSTEARKRRTRMGNMTDEERTEFTVPRSIPEARAGIAKNLANIDLRIAESEARMKQPLGRRPKGKKNGIYETDFLTVNDVEYTRQEFRGYAGELEDRPVVRAGKHFLFKDKANKSHFLTLTETEARALDDLIEENPTPTIKEVQERLAEVAKKDVGVDEELTEVADDEMQVPRLVKGKVTAGRATAVHTYIMKKAPRQKAAVPIPSVRNLKVVKDKIRDLRDANANRFLAMQQRDELATGSKGDLAIVEKASQGMSPEHVVRTNLQRRQNSLSTELSGIVKARDVSISHAMLSAANKVVRDLGRVPTAQTLQKRLQITRKEAGTLRELLVSESETRSAAILKEVDLIDDILAGRKDIPPDLLQKAADKIAETSGEVDVTKARERLNAARESGNKLQALIDKAEADIKEILGTDEWTADPNEQIRLLVERMGVDAKLKPEVQASVAKERLRGLEEAEADALTKVTGEYNDRKAYRARMKALDLYLERGASGGRTPKGGNNQKSALALEKLVNAVTRLRDNPKGVTVNKTASEPMSNFAKVAQVEAMSRAFERKQWSDMTPLQRRMAINDELMDILKKVTNPSDLNARAYLIENGVKRYGQVMDVVNSATGEILVELRPEWKAQRSAVAVPLKDMHLEYREGDIPKRYGIERASYENARNIDVGDDADVLGTGLSLTELRLGQDIKPLDTVQPEHVSVEQLGDDVTAAKAELESTFTPIGPDTPKTAREYLRNTGWDDMVYTTDRPKGKAAREALDAAITKSRTAYQERLAELGYAIDDPDLDGMPDYLDPMQEMFYLRGRTLDPGSIVRENSITSKMPRGIRSAMNFVNGMVFSDSRVKGINAQRIYHRDTAAANLWVHVGDIVQGLRRAAVDDRAAAGKQRLSSRPKGMRFSHGDRELEAELVEAFRPDITSVVAKGQNPALIQGIQEINLLPTELRAQVYDRLSRETWFMLKFPELFPNIPKHYVDAATKYQAMMEDLANNAAGVAARKASQSHSNSLMIAPEHRDFIDVKTLEKTPLQVIAALARSTSERGKSFNEALATGDELTRAEGMGVWSSITDALTERQIRALAPKGTKITVGVDGDLSHTAGRWRIKSLDKWKVLDDDGIVDSVASKDLQDSLKRLETSLNGLPDWKGMTRLSQAIASMVLTLDANILSVQGYASMSSKAVWELARVVTNPKKWRPSEIKAIGAGMKAYTDNIRQVTSDEGFHAWLKTNYDEIAYYTSLGMRTGMESFTAGTRINKMPLESLPYAGNIMRLGREFNDLQFNRWLLVMKVQGIRMQMDKAKTFRALGETVSRPFLRQAGMKEVVDEAGGELPYLMGNKEETVRAAIRTMNNKLGGISMDAQGIGAWRQTAEQIFTIVPGFFRAQAGMLSTAATRPHTVEGWLALTGMAEEIMFAGALATGIAMATGNEDKLNLTDMRKSDWMAVPFGDSYIPVIPRVAIPRVMARTIAEGFDAVSGGGFDAGPAIQSFAMGRMSPLVNAAVGPTFFDEDFLGRRYRDKKDRAFASITSFMPIFVENIASDARETAAKDGVWAAVQQGVVNTPLQFAGKSLVPRPPIQKLDEIATQYSNMETPQTPNRKWTELTSLEQDELQKNPSVAGAVKDWEYYRQRRASPKEQQIEAAFKIADERTTQLRNSPVAYKGLSITMSDAYDMLLAGDSRMDGDEYRERLRFVNGQINETMTGLDTRLKELGFDLDAKHSERVTKLRELFGEGGSKNIETQLAIWESENVTPEQFEDDVTVMTPNGEVTFAETDWDAYQEAKDRVLGQYGEDIQLNVKQVTDKWQDEGVDAYRESAQLRSQIEDMPRYRGIDNASADKLDAMSKTFRDLRDAVRAKIGLPGFIAQLPPGMNDALRAAAVQGMAQRGFIKTQDDVKLATLAILMEDKPEVRELMRGPEQLGALIQNPQVILFYPYLLSRIPVWLRGRLPEVLQPQFDVWNRYEAAA